MQLAAKENWVNINSNNLPFSFVVEYKSVKQESFVQEMKHTSEIARSTSGEYTIGFEKWLSSSTDSSGSAAMLNTASHIWEN